MPRARGTHVDVGGYRLWAQTAGRGTPTVVFESGAGDGSSVWTDVAAKLRRSRSVTTVQYDRAGLGKSDPFPDPTAYRIDEEVQALGRMLSALAVPSPLVLVAHSYGSFVSLLLGASDPRVGGLVLVDGNMPAFFDDAQVSRMIARITPHLDDLRRRMPTIARREIPVLFALPETARRLRNAPPLPTDLPVVDIVAERTFGETPEEIAASRRTHAAFVAAAKSRSAVYARGSGHYVMRDRPDLVLRAAARVIDRVRSGRRRGTSGAGRSPRRTPARRSVRRRGTASR
jgi:pimeloyl-ACP methyl ester carboxylesterase